MTRPTLSLLVPNFGELFPLDGWRGLLDVARAADDAGIDRIVVVDHVILGPNLDAYQWGRFPTGPDAPWLEPLTVLSAMAAVTERVRLSTGILVAPLRPAAVLAKTAATLDVLSGGRLDLGVGPGWQREEYDAVGRDFHRRGRLLDETLAACTALWSDAPASYDADGAHVTDVWCRPAPPQPGGVPIWIGGALHQRNLDRVVRFGRGWIPLMGASLDDIAAGAATIRTALAAAGRGPDEVTVRAPLPLVRGDAGFDLDRSLAGVPDVLATGARDIHVGLTTLAPDPAEAARRLPWLVDRFAAVTATGADA